MKIKLPAFYLVFWLLLGSSCSYQYQVFQTESANVLNEEEEVYVFENEHLEIYYDFWEEGGLMLFKMHNITDQDLYVSLDQSQFLINGYKQTYAWGREEESSLILKIPPHSGKQIDGFPVNFDWTRFPNRAKSQFFDQTDSPFVFNNLLTYSLDPEMKEVIKIDNAFWVNHIRRMKRSEFKQYTKGPDSKANKFYVSRSHHGDETIFWVDIGLSILEGLIYLF